jgi:hypothetical protein
MLKQIQYTDVTKRLRQRVRVRSRPVIHKDTNHADFKSSSSSCTTTKLVVRLTSPRTLHGQHEKNDKHNLQHNGITQFHTEGTSKTIAFWYVDDTPTVHRPGDDPCYNVIKRMRKFRGKWRVAIAHPDSIRTAYSLTHATQNAWCFHSLCSSRNVCNPPHRARHAPLQHEDNLTVFFLFQPALW